MKSPIDDTSDTPFALSYDRRPAAFNAASTICPDGDPLIPLIIDLSSNPTCVRISITDTADGNKLVRWDDYNDVSQIPADCPKRVM